MANATIVQRIALEGVEDIAKQLKELGVSGDKAFKQIKDTIDKQKLEKPAAEYKKLGEEISGVAEKVRNFAEGGVGLGLVLDGLSSRVGGPILFAFTALAGAVVAFGKSTADTIFNTDKMAKGLGLTVQQYQGLQQAAKEAGVEQDRFNAGMAHFNRQVATESRDQFKTLIDVAKQVATGFGTTASSAVFIDVPQYLKMQENLAKLAPQIKAAFKDSGDISLKFLANMPDSAFVQQLTDMSQASEKFRQELLKIGTITPAMNAFESLDRMVARTQPTLAALGISTLDAGGKMKSTFDVFREWVEKVAAIKDPTEQSQRAIEMFGRRAGPDMVKFIQQGLGGLPEILEKLKSMGAAISPEDIKHAEDLRKHWDELGVAWEGLKKTIGGPLQDPTTNLLKGLEDVAKYLGANGVLAAGALAAAGGMALAFGPVGIAITGIATALGVIISDYERLKQARAAGDQTQGVAVAGSIKTGGVSPAAELGGADSASILADEIAAKLRSLFNFGQNSSSAPASASSDLSVPGGATGGFIADGGVRRFMSGGLISGPGTGTSDSIIGRFANGGAIRVSNGEFIVNARAVKHVGLGFLNAVNKAPAYALGGLVGGLRSSLDSLSLPGFADGGLALAGADAGSKGHYTVDLRTDHGKVRVYTNEDGVRELNRASVMKQATATGRSPGWRG